MVPRYSLITFLLVCFILSLNACSFFRRSVEMPPTDGTSDGKSSTKPYTVFGKTYQPLPTSRGFVQTGKASWYGPKFHGRLTSNRETYNMDAMTAAHKTLPFNTWVKVENLDNGREAVVRINDRGPFVDTRIIDMSRAGAQKLGMIGPGTAKVRVTALGERNPGTGVKGKPPVYKPRNDYSTGLFTVQVGAFINDANAQKLAAKLRPSWGQVAVLGFDRGDHVFKRVMVGRVGTLEEANTLQDKLRASGYKNAFAVAW